jgi:hypothetical protein
MSDVCRAALVAVRPYRSAGTATTNGTDGSYPRNLPAARNIQADSANDIDGASMSFAVARGMRAAALAVSE